MTDAFVIYVEPGVERLSPKNFMPSWRTSVGAVLFSFSDFAPTDFFPFDPKLVVATPQVYMEDELEGITSSAELEESLEATLSASASYAGFGNVSATFNYSSLSKDLSKRQYFRVKLFRRFGTLSVPYEALKTLQSLDQSLLVINGVVLGCVLAADFILEYDSFESKTEFGGSLSGKMNYGLFKAKVKGSFERSLQQSSEAMKVIIKTQAVGYMSGMEFSGNDFMKKFEDHVNGFNQHVKELEQEMRNLAAPDLADFFKRQSAIGVTVAQLPTDHRTYAKCKKLVDLFAKLEFLLQDSHSFLLAAVSLGKLLDKNDDTFDENGVVMRMNLYDLSGNKKRRTLDVTTVSLQSLANTVNRYKDMVLDFMHDKGNASGYTAFCKRLQKAFETLFDSDKLPSVTFPSKLPGSDKLRYFVKANSNGWSNEESDHVDDPTKIQTERMSIKKKGDSTSSALHFDVLGCFGIPEVVASDISTRRPRGSYSRSVVSFATPSSFDVDAMEDELFENYLAIFGAYKDIQRVLADKLLSYDGYVWGKIKTCLQEKFIDPLNSLPDNDVIYMVHDFQQFLMNIINHLGWYSDVLVRMLSKDMEKMIKTNIQVYDCLSPSWKKRLNLSSYATNFNIPEIIGNVHIKSIGAMVKKYNHVFLTVNGAITQKSYVGVYQEGDTAPTFQISKVKDSETMITIQLANMFVAREPVMEHFPSSGGLPGYNLRLVEKEDPTTCYFGVVPIVVQIDGASYRAYIFSQNLRSMKIYDADENCPQKQLHQKAAYLCPFDTNSSCCWLVEKT